VPPPFHNSTREIEFWKGFADALPSEEHRLLFMKMLDDCHKYAKALNAKGEPFPSEAVLMAGPIFTA
jgi:hypothetical protein